MYLFIDSLLGRNLICKIKDDQLKLNKSNIPTSNHIYVLCFSRVSGFTRQRAA
jgi:hypothetical protein